MMLAADPPLPGNGTVTGLFWNRDRTVAAVASSFEPLINPPARAASGGRHLHHRVLLYRPPAREPFAAFDALRFPVRDVSFHPTRPLAVIGGGSYDGGFLFEGQLVLWDWQAERSTGRIDPVPEVLRCRFTDDGSAVHLVVRPWDEEEGARFGAPFDCFFEAQLPLAAFDLNATPTAKRLDFRLSPETRRARAAFETDPRFAMPAGGPHQAVEAAFRLRRFWQRSPIWDVAWLTDETFGAVHDDCLLEVYDRAGTLRRAEGGVGHGVEIVPARRPLVHVAHVDEDARDWRRTFRAALCPIADEPLREAVSLDGRYTFSVSADGWILGRCDRSWDDRPTRSDVLIDPALTRVRRHDLGHYDVFNHFVRIDGAPHLFLIQGTPPHWDRHTPPNAHRRKHLCRVSSDGSVIRLWPLLEDTGGDANHALECAYAFLRDEQGPGIVVAGRLHDPNPHNETRGVICRKRLDDGATLWRHSTRASPTTLKVVPGRNVLLCAFLNGDVAMIESDTGVIVEWAPFHPGGLATVVVSLACDGKYVVAGTLDGRLAVLAVPDLLTAGFPMIRPGGAGREAGPMRPSFSRRRSDYPRTWRRPSRPTRRV